MWGLEAVTTCRGIARVDAYESVNMVKLRSKFDITNGMIFSKDCLRQNWANAGNSMGRCEECSTAAINISRTISRLKMALTSENPDSAILPSKRKIRQLCLGVSSMSVEKFSMPQKYDVHRLKASFKACPEESGKFKSIKCPIWLEDGRVQCGSCSNLYNNFSRMFAIKVCNFYSNIQVYAKLIC